MPANARISDIDDKLHTRNRRAPTDLDEDNIFSGCFTIDPSETMDAWIRLNANTWAMEFNELPLVIHHALIRTLRERRIL